MNIQLKSFYRISSLKKPEKSRVLSTALLIAGLGLAIQLTPLSSQAAPMIEYSHPILALAARGDLAAFQERFKELDQVEKSQLKQQISQVNQEYIKTIIDGDKVRAFRTTLLGEAAQNNHRKLVDYLLSVGADPAGAKLGTKSNPRVASPCQRTETTRILNEAFDTSLTGVLKRAWQEGKKTKETKKAQSNLLIRSRL